MKLNEVYMSFRFGTKDQERLIVDLNDYGTMSEPLDPDSDEYKKAYDILHDTMDDVTFADDGCRNDDAVNSCIALHVLGYDPVRWFEKFFADDYVGQCFYKYDIKKFMEHVYRICGTYSGTNYPMQWGPRGNRSAALDYVI